MGLKVHLESDVMRSLLSPNLYGALLLVLAGVLAALSNSLVHGLSAPLPVLQMVFFKAATSLILLGLFFGKRLPKVMQTKILKVHALKGICGAAGNFFWFAALLYLPLAQSSALSLSSALFVSLGGWIFFREKFRWSVFGSLLIGFLGVFLIVNPFNQMISFLFFLPLISAAFFSASSLIIKVLSKQDSSETTLFYLMFFMCVFSLVPALFYWETPSLMDFVRLVGVGVLFTGGQALLVQAYTHAEASFISPFKFSRFPMNILVGFFLFFEVPSWLVLIGGGLILGSNLLLLKLERKKRALNRKA